MTNEEVLELFAKWNNALQTGVPAKVAKLYADDGILLPTVSNKVRHNRAEIEDYFVQFLQKQPVGKIDEANIRQFGEVIINSGIYTFSFGDGSNAQGRYTFAYQQIEGKWLIVEHHSSLMPE